MLRGILQAPLTAALALSVPQGEAGYPGLPGCKGSPGFDVCTPWVPLAWKYLEMHLRVCSHPCALLDAALVPCAARGAAHRALEAARREELGAKAASNFRLLCPDKQKIADVLEGAGHHCSAIVFFHICLLISMLSLLPGWHIHSGISIAVVQQPPFLPFSSETPSVLQHFPKAATV